VYVRINYENEDLIEARRLRVFRLNFFGIHALTVRQNDHIFAPAGDRESAISINEAQIPCTQPTIAYRFRGLVWRPVVSLHQHWTSDPHFADAFVIWRIDSDSYTAKRYSNRSDVIVSGGRDRCRSGGFG